jgi:hypothetical protein
MKKVTYILIAIVTVFMYACEPQKDVAPDIGAAPKGDFTVDNTDPNYIVLTANATDAFMYTWDLGNGEKAEGEKVTAYYPFSGNFDVTCTMSGKGGAIITKKTISVTVTDPALGQKPGFKELTNGGAGQTWIYDYKAVDNDGEPDYLYMTANYDWEEFWWNPYSLAYGHPSPDFFTKMKFDLDGGYTYTFIAEDGTETVGTFLLDMDEMTLTIIDAPIPDQNEENCDPDVTASGVYQVKILEDGHLYLWQDQSLINPDDFDYGWAWEFKPE